MPRPRRIPTYRYHKASNQAVVLDGRSHYLGDWASESSRAEYDRLIAEWLANGRRETPATDPNPSASPTVAEILLAFWRHGQGTIATPTTLPPKNSATSRGPSGPSANSTA